LGSKAVFQLNQIMTFQTVFSSLKESAGILPHSFLAGYGRVLGMKSRNGRASVDERAKQTKHDIEIEYFSRQRGFLFIGYS